VDILGGYFGSYLSGGVYARRDAVPDGTTAYSENGFGNDRMDAENIRQDVQEMRGAKTYAGMNEHFLFGVGDLLQIAFETCGLITTPSVSMALDLQKMGGGTVVAHSQGTSVFSGALRLMDNKTISNIDFIGVGGQQFIQQGNLHSAVNFRNSWDPVPLLDPMNVIRRIGPTDMQGGSGSGHFWDQYKNDIRP
jgi:hypothetical protein